MADMLLTTNATFPKSICSSDHVKLIGTTDGLFPDFGHHSAKEMGGLWMHPIKVLDGFWLRLRDEDSEDVDTWMIADQYRVEPWGDSFEYSANLSHTPVTVERTQLAPDSAKGVIVTYRFKNRSRKARRIQAELLVRTELYPVWYSLDAGAFQDGKDEGEWDEASLTFRAKDSLNPWHAAVRCAQRPASVRIGELFGPQRTSGQGTSASFLYEMTLAGEGDAELTFYMTGSAVGAQGLEENLSQLTSGRDFLAEKKARLTALMQSSSLSVGDERFERIWDWVKVHCDWLTVDAGCHGRGIGAGLPEYPWWFGCDSCYTVQGLLCAGQYELARQTLALLAAYSDKTNEGNGRIVHEITTFGLCPNPGNTQETAHFVTAVWHYWRWTGDETLVRELMPLLRRSMDWLEKMDDDGDLFPSGYGIIEIAGLNAEMIDTIVYTAQAWGCFAELCELEGDLPEARRARDLHERTTHALNTLMWDEEAGLYCDAYASPEFVRTSREHILSRRKDRNAEDEALFDAMIERRAATGEKEAGFIINHNWTLNTPMEAGLAPRDKAERALKALDTPGFIGPWGMYLSLINHEQTMTISTGTMAVAQARYGHADRALRLLERMLATFGMIGPAQLAEMSPDYGCFVQAWTVYALLTPVVRHMFGIQPDAKSGEVLLTPALPQAWPIASLARVRVLDGEMSVRCAREEDGLRLTLSGTTGLAVRVVPREGESILVRLPDEGDVTVKIIP